MSTDPQAAEAAPREVHDTEAYVARIRSNYPAFQYRFVEFIADHLSDCSRAFGGDLQQMVVLAVIGQMELHARARAAAGGAPANAAIAASRLSDATGIPRETVRRKLKILEERGWIFRDSEGAWRLRIDGATAPAHEDLRDLDERGIRRWATLLASVRPLL